MDDVGGGGGGGKWLQKWHYEVLTLKLAQVMNDWCLQVECFLMECLGAFLFPLYGILVHSNWPPLHYFLSSFPNDLLACNLLMDIEWQCRLSSSSLTNKLNSTLRLKNCFVKHQQQLHIFAGMLSNVWVSQQRQKETL